MDGWENFIDGWMEELYRWMDGYNLWIKNVRFCGWIDEFFGIIFCSLIDGRRFVWMDGWIVLDLKKME